MNLPSGESLARQIVSRPAVLHREVRGALPGGVDPRRVRLSAPVCRSCSPPAACTVSSRRSSRGTSRTGSLTTRSGGRGSTAPECSRTSRRSTRTTPRSRPGEVAHSIAQFQGARMERRVADAVRPRRRRRRPDARDARTRAPAGRDRSRRDGRDRIARRLLHRGRTRGDLRRAGPGVARRALLRDAPRHAHESDQHQARQPRRSSVPSSRPSCGRPRRASGWTWPIVDVRPVADIWPDVLTQQFHDILPGSSIAWVHRDAELVFLQARIELDHRIGHTVSTTGPGTRDGRTTCAERRVQRCARVRRRDRIARSPTRRRQRAIGPIWRRRCVDLLEPHAAPADRSLAVRGCRSMPRRSGSPRSSPVRRPTVSWSPTAR